jgi:gas vesicle protein
MGNANSKIMIGFLAGAAAGVLAGVLFAPDKGTETRKKISKKSGEAADSLKHKFNDFVDGLKETYATAKESVDDAIDKGSFKMNTIKGKAKKALQS